LLAQTSLPTESVNDIYWQPNVQVEFSDYQSSNYANCEKFKAKYGWTMAGTIVIRGVVDVPKRKGKFDKFSLPPLFAKTALAFWKLIPRC
jgi:hypothetical protein